MGLDEQGVFVQGRVDNNKRSLFFWRQLVKNSVANLRFALLFALL
jgi:hypothetical protein